jgi:phosphatidylglycerophosphatase A
VAPRPAYVAATLFGAGLVPVAPGTAGTIAAALPLFMIPDAAYPFATGILAVLAFAGSVLAARALFGGEIRAKDPGWFVLDEACGLWVAAWRPHGISPWSILFAVVVFRVLDIVKPYPIGKLESAGDCGIVLDDAAAGALTLGLGLVMERILLS